MEEQQRQEIEVPQAAARRQLALVPDEERFQGMLATATDSSALVDLRKLVAAWRAVAEQCDVATEEVLRLAIYKLEVERALGCELARSVRRGGRGSKSHAATSIRGGASKGLPEGVNKHQSRRYRALAAIPAESFAEYVTKAMECSRPPTSAGAHRFARAQDAAPDARQSASSPRSVASFAWPARVLDAVTDFMVPDVVVGDVPLRGEIRCLSVAGVMPDDLVGDVLFSSCPDPAVWLPELKRCRDAGQVGQVVVMLPVEVWAEWFKLLVVDRWGWCFLAGLRTAQGAGVLLVYHGERAAAFRDAVGRVGTVRG